MQRSRNESVIRWSLGQFEKDKQTFVHDTCTYLVIVWQQILTVVEQYEKNQKLLSDDSGRHKP